MPYSYAYKITDSEFDQHVDDVLSSQSDHKVVYDEIGEIKSGTVDIEIDGVSNNSSMVFLSQSTFNKLADFNNLEKINLNNTESLFLVSPRGYNFAKGLKSVQMPNGDKISINEMKQKNVISSISNIYSMVLSDETYGNLSDIEKVENLRFIEVENENSAQDLTKSLLKIFEGREDGSYEYRLESSEMFYNAQMEVRGMLMFVGIFIALVVLISTGSMIYFKLINEAEEEKTRYNIVRKVGASRRDVFKSIYSQMGAMFIFPIIIGLAHAGFALGALSKMLKKDLIIPTIVTMAVYVLIYGVYYILTVYKYNKTVNS
jgi:putative ABC transport system permease protein